MKKIYFGDLIQSIKTVNLLSVTLIIAHILAIANVNKYLAFIIVMFIIIILEAILQRLILKYNDNLLIHRKFFIILYTIISIAFVAYYVLQKEWGIIFLLLIFQVIYIVFSMKKKYSMEG